MDCVLASSYWLHPDKSLSDDLQDRSDWSCVQRHNGKWQYCARSTDPLMWRSKTFSGWTISLKWMSRYLGLGNAAWHTLLKNSRHQMAHEPDVCVCIYFRHQSQINWGIHTKLNGLIHNVAILRWTGCAHLCMWTLQVLQSKPLCSPKSDCNTKIYP